jgi:hypothetical protein
MVRFIIAAGFIAIAGLSVHAQEEEVEDEAQQEVHKFKVERHLFAKSVYTDNKGMCQAQGKMQLKAWYVRGFPAEIPPFESCTTISSSTTSGDVDIELTIEDSKSRSILRIDGVLDLPENGKSSQAIDWDHLKIPAPGKYFMVIKVEGQKVGRFPMLFKKRGGKKRK